MIWSKFCAPNALKWLSHASWTDAGAYIIVGAGLGNSNDEPASQPMFWRMILNSESK